MIQYILSLFGLGNKLARLQKKSSNALSAFNETLDELKKVQSGINKHHLAQQQAIEKALATQQTLMDQHASNAKVIAKIEDFLN